MEPQANEQMVQIAITVPRSEKEEVAGLLHAEGVEILPISSQGFDGAHIIDLLVKLTPPLAAIVAGVYAKRINANR
jgi:hypothetical protein